MHYLRHFDLIEKKVFLRTKRLGTARIYERIQKNIQMNCRDQFRHDFLCDATYIFEGLRCRCKPLSKSEVIFSLISFFRCRQVVIIVRYFLNMPTFVVFSRHLFQEHKTLGVQIVFHALLGVLICIVYNYTLQIVITV